MKLYDSKTNTLKEIDEQFVSMYNCGPTVYNHIHIGNARPLVTFDVLHRLLKYLKRDVKYVLNITDIDDKIINAAKNKNMSELELSNYYADQYFLILNKLNILPMINPKVTDNIEGIVDYINQLVLKNNAYFNEIGDIYFDVTSIDGYGSISHQNMDKLISGTRVYIDENKKNLNDFVLWKKTNSGIKWDSPWFKGRPGWHSECSYLINKLIGKQVTIHGGGMDLKFPHHENENAQNLALYNCDLAKVWLHIGMININNEKMSKSLNNFILVKDILQSYSWQSLRWFFYQSGIANPLNYTEDTMNQMENELKKIKLTINKAKNILIFNNKEIIFNEKYINSEIVEHLENNLNLINAVTVIYKIVKELNQIINKNDSFNVEKKLNELISSLEILGIEFDNLHTKENIHLLKQWKKYVDLKDFSNADLLRKKLIDIGIL
ncbi:MAG: cysteine--tRNA ligase [Ureaplasma sp.]|nr:cysteine--tRNA ligase [Ureaplasma sp.]